MAQVITPVSEKPTAPGLVRREEIALAVFGTWMATGLYLDGWAHIHSKPESFFTPWHAVLYSGFAAAVGFFMLDRYRHPERAASGPTDRIAVIGLLVFFAGAFGDFIWHSIFGIEVDLEALLSPTHLALLGGGVAMVSAPFRSAWARDDDGSPSFRQFVPTLASITLATAAASFFLMYLSAFGIGGAYSGRGEIGFYRQAHGIASILITNVLLLAPAMLVLRRWRPPAWTFTVLFGAISLSRVGLNGLLPPLMVFPGFVGGMTADVIVRRSAGSSRVRTARLVGAVVPVVMWTSWFGAAAATDGVWWAAELVAGTIILSALAGIVLSVLVFATELPARRPGGRLDPP
jgi:hypothetical protein